MFILAMSTSISNAQPLKLVFTPENNPNNIRIIVTASVVRYNSDLARYEFIQDVKIVREDSVINCDEAYAYINKDENKTIKNYDLVGNVVFDSPTMNIVSEIGNYDVISETIIFEGNVTVTQEFISATAQKVLYNFKTSDGTLIGNGNTENEDH